MGAEAGSQNRCLGAETRGRTAGSGREADLDSEEGGGLPEGGQLVRPTQRARWFSDAVAWFCPPG